jgi:hypothetical protein
LLLDAGFSRTEGSASVSVHGSPAACRDIAGFIKAMFVNMGQTALTLGWIDLSTRDAMVAEIDLWAEKPDAFNATTFVETVAWREG